jgi:hypothetical protein
VIIVSCDMSCDGRKPKGGNSVILKQMGGNLVIFDNLGGNSVINRKWIPTRAMPADGFTKALPCQKHEEFMKMIRLVHVSKLESSTKGVYNDHTT